MYSYYDSSIQYKKPSNLEDLTKKFFKVSETGVTRSGKPGTTLKSRLHQNFLSHEVVTRSCKNENRKLGFSRVCYSSIFQPSDIRGLH